jgi:hypothetical protein
MKISLKFSLLVLSGILLLSSFSCSVMTGGIITNPANPATAPPKNVVLIGWDGAQRNHVNECLSRDELPNLKQLASEGTLVAIDIYRTTDTKAGWTQILTGYEPEVTGVFSNGRYQPIPKGYTIFERLENFFGKDNFITAAVIGKKAHVDNDPPQKVKYKEGDIVQGEIITENGTKYQLIPGKPYFNASPAMDVFINGLEEDEKVGAKAIELLTHYKNKPFFFFVHFAQVDHKGHQFGENSKEYNDAVISADYWTGKIMQKLKELNLYDQTLIYVTADHGFDEGMKTHNDAPYVFLGTNDAKVMRRGQRADITPTILDRFGLDLNKIQPPLDGHPLTRPYQPPSWEPLPAVAKTTAVKPLPTSSNLTNGVRFGDDGYTEYGDWHADASYTSSAWQPGMELQLSTTLQVTRSYLDALAKAGIKADGFCLLVTAERTFDSDGWLRQANDERMSTLLTPAGLAIEGGIQGAVTNRFGYGFRTPVDEFQTRLLTQTTLSDGKYATTFDARAWLPDNLPPGIYRIRLDYGITIKNRYLSLNGETFARRPFFKGRPTESHLYSPPIRASGYYVSGRWVDAATIHPRVPWVILGNYNSNGYRGVVADEDSSHFALSNRNLIQDEVILPRYDEKGNSLYYSLEPQFPADSIEIRSNLPWDASKGELSVQVIAPDGKAVDLGTIPFVGKSGQWLTTKKSAVTAWKPPAYGRYTVRVTGWTADIWGNRYQGGGTYHFWIAKRLTMATATFQGIPYPVGSRYGRDIAFAPAVPASVEVKAYLYVNSDPLNVKSISYSGNASLGGIFGAAQGMKPFTLESPGEYYAQITAQYTDRDGHLWVCAMKHAGVVYPEDSSIVARGKKLIVDNKPVDRGETKFEGYIEPDGTSHLVHINYPFQASDVLLIASEQQAANKIIPVLTYEKKDKPAPYDIQLQPISNTNLRLMTSNGYSPHLFPEYITDWAYYYGAAPRPGFMSRFLVGEDGVRAPYWHVSPNNVGGQIGASNNGDIAGEIYRLVGGVVLRKKGEAPAYAGYISSCSILPAGAKNNRIITPGQEDLLGPDGTKARFFLVGTRPGMIYEMGTSFTPAVQIDPILSANITFKLVYPDGRQVAAQGTCDQFGTFAGKDKWLLDQPGVYRYFLEGDWQGHKGYMPGLPKEGGEFYVVEKELPAGTSGLKLNLPGESTFNPAKELVISGNSTARKIYYAAVTPGAVLDQGSVTVTSGKFEYRFNPEAINRKVPAYDITNLKTGQPEIKDVVHLTFFSEEVTPSGSTYHTCVRLILRGNTVIYVR